MDNNRVIEPGAVRINHAIIVASNNNYKDVTGFISKIKIFENMFSPIITGFIALTDAVSLVEMFPFTGEELLILEIETPGFEDVGVKRNLTAHLYKMEERGNVSLHHLTYVLDFMSVEGFTDMNHVISATYRGRISDNVRKIIDTSFTNSKTPLVIEDTTNNSVHTSNFWSPFKNIYYLAGRAMNHNNNPNFVFFENKDGFVFASLDSLFAIDPIQHFIKDQWTRGTDHTESSAMLYQRVLDMSVPVMYDYIDRLKYGMYGASIYTYNIQTKQLSYMVKIANEDYKSVQLNDRMIMNQALQFIPTSQVKTGVANFKLYDDSPTGTLDREIKRNSLLKRIDSMKISIEVYGRLDYTVGRTIDFTSYRTSEISENDDDDNLVDKVLSGRYVITALAHDITLSKHTCSLEICKDSINE